MRPPFGSVDVALGVQGERVLRQGGVHAVLQSRSHLGQGHTGAGQLALIPDLSRGDPDGGERSEVLEDGQPLRIELIRLMHVPHHLLRHLGVRQEREASGLFDLIDDPHRPGVLPGVPVAHGFQGHRRSFREPREKGPDGPGLVVDPGLLHGPALVIEDGKERIVLVRVTADLIMGLLQHAAPPVHWLSRIYHCSGRCSAFI